MATTSHDKESFTYDEHREELAALADLGRRKLDQAREVLDTTLREFERECLDQRAVDEPSPDDAPPARFPDAPAGQTPHKQVCRLKRHAVLIETIRDLEHAAAAFVGTPAENETRAAVENAWLEPLQCACDLAVSSGQAIKRAIAFTTTTSDYTGQGLSLEGALRDLEHAADLLRAHPWCPVEELP